MMISFEDPIRSEDIVEYACCHRDGYINNIGQHSMDM